MAKMNLSQDLFESSELVRLRNGFWDGKSPSGEFYEKYLVRLTDGREIVFGSRVSDVVGVFGKGEVLLDWAANECLSGAIGMPVIRGKDPDGNPVEVRGTWRKIDSALNSGIREYEISLDWSEARIQPWEQYSESELVEIHRHAYGDRFRSRDKAAEIGTFAHHLFELWVKTGKLQTVDSETGEVITYEVEALPPEVQKAWAAFRKFWDSNDLKLIASEQYLADLPNGIAGMADCVCEDKYGRVVGLDWKTSGAVYAEYLYQVAGYTHLWELNGRPPIDRAYIVRLDKHTAELQVVPVFVNEEEKRQRLLGWHAAVMLYHHKRDSEKYLKRVCS